MFQLLPPGNSLPVRLRMDVSLIADKVALINSGLCLASMETSGP